MILKLFKRDLDLKKILTKDILKISFTSFFNDIASDMIYPLIPVFLSTLTGVSAALYLGIIEGFAETVSAILKLYSGIISDNAKRKKPFVVLGYLISNLTRPLMGFSRAWSAIFTFRFFDRVGKGLRSAPRDAMLSHSAPKEHRGLAFSFQRAMDNLGAFIGPLIASFILFLNNNNIKTVFFLSIIPGILSVIMFSMVKEEKKDPLIKNRTEKGKSELPASIKWFVVSLIIFTLGNSTDAFLILKAKDSGLSIALIPILWSVFHLAKIILAPVAGMFSDILGRKKILITGWLIYSVSYFLFSLKLSPFALWAVFILYGSYYALTEGVEKALIADLAGENIQGKAFGLYNFTSIAKLPASLIFGFLWVKFSPQIAFLTGAFLSMIALLIMVAKTKLTQKVQG